MHLSIKKIKGSVLVELLALSIVCALLVVGMIRLKVAGLKAAQLLQKNYLKLTASALTFDQINVIFNQLGGGVLRLTTSDEKAQRVIFFDKSNSP